SGVEGRRRAAEIVRTVVAAAENAFGIVAADEPAWVEQAVRAGAPRERGFGSAPIAWLAALRRRLAAELRVGPGGIAATLLGLPPRDGVALRDGASVAGVPIEKLSHTALRRAVEGLRSRALGPVALAAAAERLLRALASPRPSVLPLHA